MARRAAGVVFVGVTLLGMLLSACGSPSTTRQAATVATATARPGPTPTPVPTQHVFFGVDSYTAGGTNNVYALNAADGSITWTSAPISIPIFAVAETDETVYVFSQPISSDGEILALRASDGIELWHVAVSKSLGVFGGQGFAVDSGIVYVGGTLGTGDYANTVSAYRASDGTLLWSKSGLGTLQVLISAANGVVYAAAMDSVTALRGSDGTELWQQQSLSHEVDHIESIPVAADGTVYVPATGDVFALSTTDGSVRWHYRAPVDEACDCVQMVSVGGGQVYATERNSIVALSAANGAVVYKLPGSSEVMQVSYAAGIIYSTWYGGKLIATRASDGSPLWSVTLHPGSGGIGTALTNALFVGSDDQATPRSTPQPGVIYALRPSDGSQLWQFQPPDGTVGYPVVG